MKSKQVFWGIFFLVCSALVIFFTIAIPKAHTATVIWSVVLGAILFASIIKREIFGIIAPLTALLIIHAEALHIHDNLTPWPIIITAVLAGIGLSTLFHGKGRHHELFGKHNFTEDSENIDEDSVSGQVTFGASSKYITSQNFKKASFSCKFGAMKIYFNGATLSPEGAELYLNVSFSGIEMYVPKTWKVEDSLDCSLSGIEEKNKAYPDPNQVLTLRGSLNLSGIEIIYV